MKRKLIQFNQEKNKWLKNRGISFEEIIELLENGRNLLDDIRHKRYKHQRIFVIKIENYVYLVPYVEDKEKIFLKTAFPSRKATRQYLKKQKGYEKKK